jgi:hypothetical protein
MAILILRDELARAGDVLRLRVVGLRRELVLTIERCCPKIVSRRNTEAYGFFESTRV